MNNLTLHIDVPLNLNQKHQIILLKLSHTACNTHQFIGLSEAKWEKQTQNTHI